MDRRKFIRDVLLWSVGAAAIPHFKVGDVLAAQVPPVVAFTRGKDYALLVEKVLAPLGGMAKFIRPGARVVVKPNMAWDRTPEQGANTHPLVVKAVVEQALAAGAARVLVFDRPCNEKRRCYIKSGILPALQEIKDRRLQVTYIDDRKFVPITIERGKSLTRLELYRDALEADTYINMPVAKHHGLSKLTLGLKNSMGVMGGDRGMMHHDLGQKLADLATVLKPTLTIIDATRMLLRNGPQGGDPDDVRINDTLIASTDPVAADAYATTLFGMQPEEIDSTVAAHRLGLGEMAIARMKIVPA